MTAQPPPMGSHADAAVFRVTGWFPADSGVRELDRLHAEHEADVAAVDAARRRLSDLAGEHAAHERRVAESARARARGEDVPVVRSLPEAARQQELALARVDVDAAVAVLDERNVERKALIAAHGGQWIARFEGEIAKGEEEIDQLMGRVNRIRERQRMLVVLAGWAGRAADPAEPAAFAGLVEGELGPARRRALEPLGADEAADALDAPLRRATGRLSSRERMAGAMSSRAPAPELARGAGSDPNLTDRVATALADAEDDDEPIEEP